MTDPLVLIPGMMCDARVFWPQIMALSGDHTLHLANITQGNSIEEMAQNILTRAPQRFALAGVSLGGIVAMEVARRAPDRVSRLALMDTNPLAETPQVAALREPQIARARAGRLADVIREDMKPAYLAPGPGQDDVLAIVMQMALDIGPDVYLSQSRALQRRPDQQAVLRKLKIPALVLCGVHDALCPVRRHEFMAELIPQATLKVIADAGHLPTLEQPDVTNQILKTWLEGAG